jgi:Ca2+-binding RTX toxin-like protein
MRTLFRAAGLAIAISLVLATAALARYIVGTSGPDLIGGTQSYDTIRSGPGSDRVWGKGRADHIHGGSGNDLLMGDWGSDWVYGLTGNDTLIGGAGNDHLFGEDGDDTLWVTGDGAPDFAGCGAGDDTVYFDWNDTVAATCEHRVGPIAHRNH